MRRWWGSRSGRCFRFFLLARRRFSSGGRLFCIVAKGIAKGIYDNVLGHDLPNWLFGTLTVAAFVGAGVAGLFITRRWVERLHAGHSYNDIVGFYLAGMAVFFGVTLGLLAIGAWTTYSDVQGKVSHEAIALGALYRDIGAYPDPVRSIMQDDLRRYTRAVIDVGWPIQQRGIVPNNAKGIRNDFQEHLCRSNL